MTNKKSPISLRILYWFSLIIFWVFTVFASYVVISLITYGITGKEKTTIIYMPVETDIQETGSLLFNGDEIDLKLIEINGKLLLPECPSKLNLILAIVEIPIFIIVFFILYKFKKFAKTLKEKNIFIISNIRRIKHIAYLLLGLWIYSFLYFNIAFRYLIEDIVMKNSEISLSLYLFIEYIIAALVLWTFAHIFMVGLKLQEESDLTI